MNDIEDLSIPFHILPNFYLGVRSKDRKAGPYALKLLYSEFILDPVGWGPTFPLGLLSHLGVSLSRFLATVFLLDPEAPYPSVPSISDRGLERHGREPWARCGVDLVA